MTSSKLHAGRRAILSRRDPWTEMLDRWRVPLGIALLAVLVCFVYWPGLHGGLILDDELLTQNKLIKAPDGLYRFWFTTEPIDYWPVTSSAFWLQWRLWGDDVTGYHLTNLAFHIADAHADLADPGAFSHSRCFFSGRHFRGPSGQCGIRRLDFAVEESVALLFALLATWCYLKADDRWSSLESPQPQESSLPWYLLSLMLFVLGLLSKGSVAVLPALLLLIVWWRRPITRWDFSASALSFVVRATRSAECLVSKTRRGNGRPECGSDQSVVGPELSFGFIYSKHCCRSI